MRYISQEIAKNIKYFFPESEAYNQPQTVDLEKNFLRYSFLTHHPEKQSVIDHLFQKIIIKNKARISFASLLLAPEFQDNDLSLLEEMEFRQLNCNPEIGIVLEHDDLSGWLIKKSYAYKRVGNKSMRIAKAVGASDFPSWMLPPLLRGSSKNVLIGIQVPNDVINPLRVVMLERGQKWIDHFHLNSLKTATEYLYFLPGEENSFEKPLHQRVVVISRKENILNEKDNLQRFVDMAYLRPNKLRQLADQISLFIKYTQLTDTHLHNLRFLDDDTDTLMFIDGEPIGGLADVSQPEMVDAIGKYDRGFFSLLGLKKFTTSIREQMEDENFPESDIQKVQEIFEERFKPVMKEIIRERRWHMAKVLLGRYCSFFNFILAIFATIQALNQRHAIRSVGEKI